MVYKHAVLQLVTAFGSYAQRGEDTAKREVGGSALNSYGNFIVHHRKSCKIMELCF